MKAFELNISTIPLLALSEYGRYCYGSQVTPFSTDKTPNLKWSKKKKKMKKKRWKSDLRWKKRAQIGKMKTGWADNKSQSVSRGHEMLPAAG